MLYLQHLKAVRICHAVPEKVGGHEARRGREDPTMLRQIVVFDRERCNGCGLCVHACHEGAIGLVEGKAALLRDDFCDGMGDCLPACPMDAIRFEQREALPYDEAAVLAKKAAAQAAAAAGAAPAAPAVPGVFSPMVAPAVSPLAPAAPQAADGGAQPASRLAQWPCQIKLVGVNAPFFQGARLLVAADCTAFACPDFHERFMAGRVTLVGCPKLDAVDYSEKLGAIMALNDIREVLMVRMDVPCCGGLQRACAVALSASGKSVPNSVVTLGRDGRILRTEPLV